MFWCGVMFCRMQYRSITALSVVLVSLAGCGVSIKPDHPQVFQKFDDRRAPMQNALVQQGAYAEQFADEPKSQFVPYSGAFGNSAVAGGIGNKTGAGSAVQEPAAALSGGVQQQEELKQSAEPSAKDQGDSSGVLSRIKQLFSELEMDREDLVRHVPIENLAALQPDEPYVEQGSSTIGYSYYDMADEVRTDNAKPVIPRILFADGRNAASSLVEIPNVETHQEIKHRGIELPRVELNEQVVAPAVVQQPSMLKHNKAKPAVKVQLEGVEVMQKTNTERVAYEIHDHSATLQYQNGRPVVMGSLGRK
jgi:hypothetical protein